MTTASGSCGSGSGSKNVIGDSGFTPTDEMPVFFTPPAIEAVRKALKEEGDEGDFLRVSVVGGGCSGYQYGLDFELYIRKGELWFTETRRCVRES